MFSWFKSLMVIVTLCFTTLYHCDFASADNNIEFLNSDLIKQLNAGIYEVVTPKKENDQITYERELPFEQLDYIERNEKYFSIGTAFFINNEELMTAAHVLGLEYFSQLQDYYIRDQKGRVFPINMIRRYSTHRDMVVFDLKEYPESFMPLNFNGEVSIGDTVFSVGNAQGEGIAYRAGQVASFTPEREYGKWKNIRFTSPASPGNSGGPLLNLQGKVLGIIVQKNESENYNIAVPIKELENLTDQSEFHIRNVSIGLEGVNETLTRDWSFSFPLPAPIQTVAALAQENLNSHILKMNRDLTDKVKDKNFPKGKRFRDYLRNQSFPKGFAYLLPETDFKKWEVRNSYRKKIPISATQNVFWGKSYFSDLDVIVEKPETLSLQEFLDSPKLVMDNLLKGVPFHRKVGEEKINMISLGQPEQSEVIQDRLGRSWITSLWNLPHTDSFVYSSCLPYPKGVICNIDSQENNLRKYGYFDNVHDSYNEIIIGYSGEIKDWQEYFSLPEKYLPTLFQRSKIYLKDNSLQVKLDDLIIDFDSRKINGHSSIHFHLGYSNKELLAEDLLLIEIYPEKGAKSHYRIQPFFEPSTYSSDTYKSTWKDINNGAGLYSGTPSNQNELTVIKKVFEQTRKTFVTFPEQEIKQLFSAGCYYKTTDVDIEEDCHKFFQSISFN